MKKLLNNRISHLLFLVMMLIITMLTSCNNDETSNSAPVITEVRNYAAAPNDTLVDKLVPGQWVVLKGSNLKDAVKIAFNGIPVEFNGGLFSDTYAVVQIPSVIPFPSIPENQLNTIEFVNASGSTIFNIDIIAGPPALAGISNENPVAGDVVTVSGTNLFLIREVNFGGAIITDYESTNDGTSISFVVPNVTTSGPLSITTASGTSSTVFNVNNYATTDVFCNFDDKSPLGWGGWGTTVGENISAFPNSIGKYGVLNMESLGSYDWGTWNYNRMIRTNEIQLLPVENLSDPLENWAVKFEINISGSWNGITLFVTTEKNELRASFKPWKISASKTANVTTGGKWLTVTIPLSTFNKGWDNKGDFATDMLQLFNAEGKAEFAIYTMNVDAGPSSTGFYAAIDNIRVVKIK